MIEGTVEQACEYLDSLQTPAAIRAALEAAGETRKGVLNHAEALIQASYGPASAPDGATAGDPATEGPGDQFGGLDAPQDGPKDPRLLDLTQAAAVDPRDNVFIVRAGAPSMMTLRPTRGYFDNLTQQRKEIPGVVYKASPCPDGSGARMIDCNRAPETRRPNDPVAPAEMAAMIRATPYYAQGRILDLSTWELMRQKEQAAKAAADAVRQEFDQRIAAKIAKRGAATADVHGAFGTGVQPERQV